MSDDSLKTSGPVPEQAERSLISNLSTGLSGVQPQVSTPAE